jgi:hypothetical protein
VVLDAGTEEAFLADLAATGAADFAVFAGSFVFALAAGFLDFGSTGMETPRQQKRNHKKEMNTQRRKFDA